MKGKEFLGIDPGLDGAIVRIDRFGKIVQKDIMPVHESVITKKGKKSKKREVDAWGLAEILRSHSDVTTAYLEKVGSMPQQGIASTFKFGRYYGFCEMGLAALQIPYTLITPQAWMKLMHQGISKEHDAKTRSKMLMSRRYPSIDFRPTERSKKQHDGLVDAFLIAQYALRIESPHTISEAAENELIPPSQRRIIE